MRENRQERKGGGGGQERAKINKQRGKERNMSPNFPLSWSQFTGGAPCHREVVPRLTHLKLFKHPLGCFLSCTRQTPQDQGEMDGQIRGGKIERGRKDGDEREVWKFIKKQRDI